MDLGTLIVGLLSIGVCILPMVIFNNNRKKGEKLILQYLSNIAIQHNCQITKHEICGEFGIGIDESKNFIMFFDKRKNKMIEQVIDLEEVQNCTLNKSMRTIANREGNQTTIDRLELTFAPKEKNKAGVSLELFNKMTHVELNGELQSAELWSKLIGDRLKHKN